jgi:DNA ligase-1
MTFFDQTLTLIDKIAATPGKNDKIDLLKNHGVADEARLKRVLELCYSPRFRFGISYVEPAKVEVPEFSTYDNAFFPLLEDLNSRKLSGDAAREAVDKFITEASASAGELLRRVIHKDMRAGFSGSTTNKVFAKLIPDHPYMRCSLPKDVKLNTWEWDQGVFAQLKADGSFQAATIVGGEVTIESRSGEIMPNEAIPAIVAQIKSLPALNGYRLEGELTVVNTETGETLARGEGNGIINSLRQGGELAPNLEVHYTVWECVDLSKGGTIDARPYKDRFADLEIVMMDSVGPMAVAETNVIRSEEEAWGIFKTYATEGLEGAIIKRPSMIWKDGTSKDQVKLKTEFEAEFRITGFIEGKPGKKTAATFGSLTYESADGIVRGSVSGIDDDLRAKINANRGAYIGAITTIRANALTQNRNDSVHWALSHPRVIEVRTDKTEADTYAQVRAAFENSFKV